MGRARLNGQSGEKPLKYPIKLRKVSSVSIKKGDKLVTNLNGTVSRVSDMAQSTNLIIPTPINTTISKSDIYDCTSRLRILKFTEFNAVFTLSATQLKLSIVNMNKNQFNSKTDFLLKTGTSLSSIAVEKLSETKIFIKYIDSVTDTNIQVYGMVVDVNNIANPTILKYTSIESYTNTNINNAYVFDYVNVFIKSSGVYRVYFLGAKLYGGARFSYIDIASDFSTMSQVSTYTGTLPSVMVNYMRSQRAEMQVYLQDASITGTYTCMFGYQNSTYGVIIRSVFNHDTNTVVADGNNYPQLDALQNFYSVTDGFVLSNDKTYLLTYSFYEATTGYGVTIVKIPLNADWTMNTTKVTLYLGNLPSNGSGSIVRTMMIQKTPFDNEYLISLLYCGTDSLFYSYFAMINIKGAVTQSKLQTTFYLDTMVSDYSYLKSRIIRQSLCEYFQFGILNYGDTTFSCRVIDFDHVLSDAVAKSAGASGDIIEVYQITNHE